MRNTIIAACLTAAIGATMVGCATAPKTEARKEALSDNVTSTLKLFKSEDPSLATFMDKAYGYAVFPSVGKGGLIVGGAYGKGEVFEKGTMVGFADITGVSVGLQAGGQSFAEVICFETKAALDRFCNDNYELAANASAVAVKSGASTAVNYRDGVAVLTYVKGGLMAEASVGGQRFRFTSNKR